MKIYIIYHKIFDLDGNTLTIGGIQTYLLNLSQVFLDNKMTPVIFQLADKEWIKEYKGIKVHGIKKLLTTNGLKQSEHILNEILQIANTESDLVIWGTDNIAVKTNHIKTLAIQHGIGFDYIANGSKTLQWIKKLKLQYVYKYLQRRKSINSFTKAEHKVCVDYNYLNWIRTMLPREELHNIHVIPNFTHVNNDKNINFTTSDNVKILFARRFSEERGVLILFDIVDEILKKYTNVSFTIAGSGPYEKQLYKKYGDNENVTITQYAHEESLSIHTQHHIAIIPTYGSEGTSLSLLEAMTSGCVPIASNVGGMTNIVIDGFNGFLVEPTAITFINKLSLLIKNSSLRQQLSLNAKESVNNAFSFDRWSKNWISTIKNV